MKHIEEVLEWAENVILDQTGEPITPIEEAILKGVWQRQTYPQIAETLNCSPSHVKKEAAKLWDKLRDELGKDLKKYNFRSKVEKKHRVSQSSQANHCLQVNTVNQVDTLNIDSKLIQSIKTPKTRSPSSPSSTSTENRSPIIDLTDAPELTDFYNRTTELSTLKQWILKDHTRLITIYGFSEIGKSTLTLKLIEQIHNQFDYIIWRSPSNVPTLSVLKTELKEFFAQSQPNPLPTVLDYFRNSRCLLILDDLQTIFQSGQLAGEYLTEYKEYGKFFKQIARNHHQSCVILLSWEKSRDLATLEGKNRPARTLHLKGLESGAEEILRERGLTDEERWPELINLYQGHPTWLNIIASTIVELFDGRVSLFLGDSPQPDGGPIKIDSFDSPLVPPTPQTWGESAEIFLGDLEPILESQLERLSELEQQVISCFRENEAIALSQQPANCELSQSEFWSAMQSLVRRGLVEKISEGGRGMFLLNPIWQQYIK